MKKLPFYLILLLTATSINATEQKVGAHYAFSDDSDSAESHRYTLDYFYNDYGISYTNVNYKGGGYNFYGDRVGLLLEKDHFEADIGLFNYNGRTQIDGDAKYSNQYSDFLFYEVGIEHSPIDSIQGLNDHLTATTVYTSIDLYSPTYDAGVALVPAITYFEDNGEREQIKAKVYKGIGHGLHVYARTRHYNNTNPDNGVFFSPKQYTEFLYGLGARRYFWGGFIRGHIDYGYQKINDFREDSWTYRIAYKKDHSDYEFYFAFEENDFSKFYTYRHSEIGVYYKF